jgi:hypothetical protein
MKFAAIDDFSLSFSSLIEEDIKNISPIIDGTFNPSNIVECPRKIMYKSMGETNNHKIDDKIFKNKWLDFFSKSTNIKLINRDVLVVDCNYNLGGKLDAILNINDIKSVLKIYFINDNDFSLVKEEAFKKHVMETMTYMWLTEIKNGLILYENKNTGEYLAFHVIPYKSIIESIKKKFSILFKQKIKGEMPSKPYDSCESDECKLCECKQKCWENNNGTK